MLVRMLNSNLDAREESDYRGCMICRQQGMKMGQEPVANWVDAHGLYMCDKHMQSHGADPNGVYREEKWGYARGLVDPV